MPVIVFPPASIEGLKVLLVVRKIIPGTPVKNSYPEIKAAILYAHVFDRNSAATIEDECNPKKYIIDKNSMLNKGDGIRGDSISSYTVSPIRPEVKKASGQHKSSFIKTKGYTYAKLEKAYKGIENIHTAQLR